MQGNSIIDKLSRRMESLKAIALSDAPRETRDRALRSHLATARARAIVFDIISESEHEKKE